jgi:hypothetical protein
MLQPNQQWCWYSKGEYLALELGDMMCFKTPYTLSSMSHLVKDANQFTLEQHAIYSAISETFDLLEEWSEAQKTQYAINALALSCFGKTIAAKSWYFAAVSCVQELSQYQIAYLKLDNCYSTVLILQFDTNSAYCMLIDKQLDLGDGRVLSQFSPLKVMINRLFCHPV